MSVSILEIIKQNKFEIDEAVLWSILSCGSTYIQNKISSGDYELCLMSLESMFLSAEGQLKVKTDANMKYSRSYLMPEVVELKEAWYAGDDRIKAEILLYSLGISLNLCSKKGKNQTSPISDTLRSLIDQIIDRIAANRLTLLEVLRTCTSKAKDFTRGKTFNYHLYMFYKSYKRPNDTPKMIRSMSHSNVRARVPNMDYTRQLSLDSIDIEDPPSDPINNSFNKDSSFENINNRLSQSSSISSLSPSFSENPNKGQITTSNYTNLMINAIDPQPNITEAFEKVRARRKVLKNNGPVKCPTNTFLSQSLNNSWRASGEDTQGSRNSFIDDDNFHSLIKGPLEISTIERLGGFRHMLGPEFAIRSNESYNIHSHSQRKSFIFSRTESGRLIRSEVLVKLLNGVVLSVKSLNSKSTIGQVINAIHPTYPDLEFVNYGLCFTLDSEFFFLKEDCNVYKLIKYLSQKNSRTKGEEKLNLNSGLHLYYRLKYYPTMEIVREMNSLCLRLLYWQLRQDIITRSLPPLSLAEALFLVGAAVQTEFGDKTENLKDQPSFLKMEYYLHKKFIRSLNVADEEKFLKEQQTAWQSFKWYEGQQAFIEKVIANKYYGLHWYKVNKTQLSVIGAIGKDTFIVIGRQGIQLVDVWKTNIDVQIQWHFNYKWKQIDMITIKNKKLIIKPKMHLKLGGTNDSCAFVCYMDSRTKAEYIVKLCTEHHLLASQEDAEDVYRGSICNNTGSHMRLSTVDYPLSLGISVDEDDDDIFIDHSSSDEDDCRSSKMSSFPHRLGNMRSLENLNKEHTEEPSTNLGHGKMSNTLDQNDTLQKSTDLNSVDENYLIASTNIPHEPPSGNTTDSKGAHPYTLFEVEINRVKDESIGIGILSLKTKDLQGIFIKCFTENSVAEKCGKLRIGDEIISINNEPVSHITQDEVREVIMNSGNNIRLLLRRHNTIKIFENKLEVGLNSAEEADYELSNGNHLPETPVSSKILKTNIIFQKCLSSLNSLEILRSKYTSIAIPPANLDKVHYFLKSKIERLSDKELKVFKQKLSWNSTNVKHDVRKDNLKCEITIHLNDLFSRPLGENLDVPFSMVCTQSRNASDTFWQYVADKETRLIINLGVKSLADSLLQNKEVIEKRFEVKVGENCDLDDTLKVRRLQLNGLISPYYCDDGIYDIQFCEWDNKRTSVDTMVQIANLACTLNLNIPNEGPIVIVYDDPSNKPDNFIVLYTLILVSLHCEVPVDPIIGNKTLVQSIYSQIIQQSKWLIPSELHFGSCISGLKLLLAYMNGGEGSSEDSDIE